MCVRVCVCTCVCAFSVSATIHRRNVYISAQTEGKLSKAGLSLLVCAPNEDKWSTLPVPHAVSNVVLVNNHITSIRGWVLSTGKAINMLSTWNEKERQWKQVLPSMPTGWVCTAVISHDNLLLVTGGLAEDCSTVLNTCDVLDPPLWSGPLQQDSTCPHHYGGSIWHYAENTSTWLVRRPHIPLQDLNSIAPRRGERSGVMSSRLHPYSTSSQGGVCGPK